MQAIRKVFSSWKVSYLHAESRILHCFFKQASTHVWYGLQADKPSQAQNTDLLSPPVASPDVVSLRSDSVPSEVD